MSLCCISYRCKSCNKNHSVISSFIPYSSNHPIIPCINSQIYWLFLHLLSMESWAGPKLICSCSCTPWNTNLVFPCQWKLGNPLVQYKSPARWTVVDASFRSWNYDTVIHLCLLALLKIIWQMRVLLWRCLEWHLDHRHNKD